MKKVLVVVIVLSFFVVGCNMQDATPPQLEQALIQNYTDLAILRGRIDDPEFWTSAETATDLIAKSIEKGEYKAAILFKNSDGEEFVAEYQYTFSYMNDTWRELVKRNLLRELAINDDVEEAHENNQTVVITGTVLSHLSFAATGAFDDVVEVYDLNNDGVWDPAKSGP